jgi:hypothetical protein
VPDQGPCYFSYREIKILFHREGTHSLYTSAIDTLKLKQKSISMQDEDLGIGYGSRIELRTTQAWILMKLIFVSFADQIFGSHLHTVCEREHSTVPWFVKQCIEAVEKRGG